MMDAGRVVLGRAEVDRRDRGDRVGEPDEGPCLRHGHGDGDLAERRVDVRDRGLDLGRERRVAVQVPFGEPDAADVHRPP